MLGEHWVFLAKTRLIPGTGQMWLPGEAEDRRGYGPGIFETFMSQRVEKIVTDLTPESELEGLRAQGVTPVIVPHDDSDHR